MIRDADSKIDWVRDAELSIRTRLSSKSLELNLQSVSNISERLSALLLERLPPDLANRLTELLPESRHQSAESLQKCANTDSEPSIGYPSFIEMAAHALGRFRPEEEMREIVDAFLWGVIQGVPADLKARLHEVLPSELKSRMDLYSDRQRESKVA